MWIKVGALTALAFVIVILAACSPTMQKAFPRTTAGFEEGGVVGAVQGAASGAKEILGVVCQTLDGDDIVVTVDLAAAFADRTELVGEVRTIRQSVCAAYGFTAADVAPAG